MGLFSGKRDVAQLQADRDFKGLANALLKGSDDERNQAIEAVVALSDPASVEPISLGMERLGSNPEGIAAGQEALRRLGPIAVEPLVALLQSGKSIASWHLAGLGEEIALPAALELIESDDRIDREVGATTLLDIHTPAALDAFVAELQGGPAQAGALAGVKERWAGGEPAVIRGLLEYGGSGGENELETASYVLDGLTARVIAGTVDRDTALKPLLEGADDPRANYRFLAILALYLVAGKEAPAPELETVFVDALSDPDPRIRWMPGIVLGRQKDPRALAPLIDLLDSEVDERVTQAAAGLGMLGDPAALPALREHIDRGTVSGEPRRIMIAVRDSLEKKLEDQKRVP